MEVIDFTNIITAVAAAAAAAATTIIIIIIANKKSVKIYLIITQTIFGLIINANNPKQCTTFCINISFPIK